MGRLTIAVLIGAAFALQPSLAAEPTLYERLAASPLVIHGRCEAIGKRATIEVLGVFKGNWPDRTLEVAFRGQNYNRQAGTEKIVFELGGESLFVLVPERDSRERVVGGSRFALAGGLEGKIDIPSEGGPALLDAGKRLCAIQKLANQNDVWAAHRQLVSEANPHLARAGLEEVLKFHLGDESVAPAILNQMVGPRLDFRKMALQVAAQIFEREVRTGKPLASSDLLARETLARATGDESPEVRVEAVRALRRLRRSEFTEAFEQMASADTSQMVRYEAQVALKELNVTAR